MEVCHPGKFLTGWYHYLAITGLLELTILLSFSSPLGILNFTMIQYLSKVIDTGKINQKKIDVSG